MTDIDYRALEPGMTLDEFRALEPGDALHLEYSLYNSGRFIWIHSHVEGDKVFGKFWYLDVMEKPSEIGDYLYEFEGKVCRGSGAEPVRRVGYYAPDRMVNNG